MSRDIVAILFVVAFFIVVSFVLPRLGVRT